jgi:hypothetical protein
MIDGSTDDHLIGRMAGDAPDVDNTVRLRYDEPVAPGTVVAARITDAGPYETTGNLVRGRPAT